MENIAEERASQTSRSTVFRFQLRGVSKEFGGTQQSTMALRGIDLDIGTQEFLCLVGESGCGKSTLLRILAGFDTPTDGEALFDGKSIQAPGHERGMVFQQASLLPWLSVRRNISLGLDIRGQVDDKDARVASMIERVGLDGFERHLPAQLSGGMAQRVAIARALVNEPEVLLLDEPFGALDAFTRIRMQHALLDLWASQGFTAVFVTHDLDEAVYLASRIVVLTPRPGEIARIFNVDLRRPRDRMSPEFFRVRSMIGQEFSELIRDKDRV